MLRPVHGFDAETAMGLVIVETSQNRSARIACFYDEREVGEDEVAFKPVVRAMAALVGTA